MVSSIRKGSKSPASKAKRGRTFPNPTMPCSESHPSALVDSSSPLRLCPPHPPSSAYCMKVVNGTCCVVNEAVTARAPAWGLPWSAGVALLCVFLHRKRCLTALNVRRVRRAREGGPARVADLQLSLTPRTQGLEGLSGNGGLCTFPFPGTVPPPIHWA